MPNQARQGDVATWWAETHPTATIEEAYRAGYEQAIQTIRGQRVAPPPQPAGPPMDKTYRTLAAALARFRDEVLSTMPEEVETGEWLTPLEATTVIAQLQEALGVH